MRDLTAGMVTAVQKPIIHVAFLYEGEFSDGGGSFVRLWTGIGDLVWDSKTFNGAGELGGFSPVSEGSDFQANNLQVFLSGLPSTLISTALGSARRGLPGRLWVAEIDPETMAITADPYKVFEGKLDVPVIEDSGDSGLISITYESKALEADRASENRYTPETQIFFFPGDKGFDYVASVQEWDGNWGKP